MTAADQDLHELHPAPGVLLRHRGADLEVHDVPRSGPRVELRDGALWVRASDSGPGVTISHGASSIQLGAGALVVEVHEVEALVLVAAGRAAVKGRAPLPRGVNAGQAVALTIDGTTSEPDRLEARELADDRMVVENLARDLLASRPADSGPDPIIPHVDPRPELVLRSEHAPLRAAPSEHSALETALAGVGIDRPAPEPAPVAEDPLGAFLDGPRDPAAAEDPSRPAEEPDASAGSGPEGAGDVDGATDEGTPEAEADPLRRRKLIALVVVAMVLLAIVAAIALSGPG